MKHVRPVIFVIVLTLLVPGVAGSTSAQQGRRTAGPFMRQALSDLAVNCASLEHNEACYGFNEVRASFFGEDGGEFFTRPAERAALTTLVDLAGTELNVDDEIWGIGIMKLQANIHNALPGDHVLLVSLGEVRLENAVDPEDALLPVEPLGVTALADANLYKAPDPTSDVLGAVAGAAIVQVDAVSPDGQWLRALHFDGERYAAAWVSRQAVAASVDVARLPVVGSDTMAPMQEFFLQTGLHRPNWPDALPSILLVQGPLDTDVDFIVNGAPIRLSSTIILQILPPGKTMRLTTLSGMAAIFPDTPGEILVPPGHWADVCLTDADNNGGLNQLDDDQVLACDWSRPRPLTQATCDQLAVLPQLPENVVNYEIECPSIVKSSGVGRAFERFHFRNPNAVKIAQKFCDQGKLSADVCRSLFG